MKTTMKKTTGRKAGNGHLAWHVRGWEQCYEPAKDVDRGRRSPLPFVKLLTGAGDHGGREAAEITLQDTLLRNEPDTLQHEAIWVRLLKVAGNRSEYRGFFLGLQLKPATIAEIAVLIGVNPDRLQASLEVLQRLGYIDRVPLPTPPCPAPTGRPAAEDAPRTPKRPAKAGTGGKKPKPQTAKKNRRAKPGRPQSGPTGARRDPGGSERDPSGSERGPAGGKRGPTAGGGSNLNRELERLRQQERLAPEREPEQTEPERPTAPAHGNGSNSARAKTATAKPGDGKDLNQRPQRAAAAAEADEPTTADPSGAGIDGGHRHAAGAPAPAGSVSSETSQTSPAADATGTDRGRRNRQPSASGHPEASALPSADPAAGQANREAGPRCLPAAAPPSSPRGSPAHAAGPTAAALAHRTYAEIYGSTSAVTRGFRARCDAGGADVPRSEIEFGVRERACFEAAWTAVLSLDLEPQALLLLQGKASKEAKRISRRSTKWRKGPGAAWRHWINQHMESDAGVGKTRWRRATQQIAADRQGARSGEDCP